jgi:hypothetical protein
MSLKEAESKFREIRLTVYRVVEQVIHDELGLDIRLASIRECDAEAADNWVYPPGKNNYQPGWSWRKEVKQFQRRPRRVEAAFWVDSPETLLCGLVLGRISNRRIIASLHYIESNPEQQTQLKGNFAQIAVRYLELHAMAAGCSTIAIALPRPTLIEFYKQLGFTHQITKGKKVLRLERRVDL